MRVKGPLDKWGEKHVSTFQGRHCFLLPLQTKYKDVSHIIKGNECSLSLSLPNNKTEFYACKSLRSPGVLCIKRLYLNFWYSL